MSQNWGPLHRKHPKILTAIEKARHANIPVEVNAVLTAETFPGILDLVKWCHERDIALKILDVVSYDSQPGGYIGTNKVPGVELDKRLRELFGEPERVQLSGERGIYMKKYGSTPHILFKDCGEGTTFTSYCQGCRHFPCEEGIHHLSLSTDGNLRPCRIRNNIFWNLRPVIAAKDADRVRGLVKFMLEVFYTGEFALSPYEKTGLRPALVQVAPMQS
jgi:MoaA/NifB/PqqE/SkfB family radical SAM enzyme